MFDDLRIIGQGNIFFDVLKENVLSVFYAMFFFSNKAIIYLFAGYDDDSKLESPETATRNCCRGENKLAIVRIQRKYVFY